MEMYDYWFSRGKSDERKHIPLKEALRNFNFEEDAFAKKNMFFYRLGRAHIIFANNPTRLELLNEIYDSLRETHFPSGKITFSTKHYSHRLLKKVFIELGYQVQTKPNCSNFYARPI